MTPNIPPPAHLVHSDHHGGWIQILSGKASEPETSRPVKKRNFYLPYLHLAPLLGVIPSEFRRDLLRHKTSPMGYRTVILRLAVLIQCWPVTDGRTDTRRQLIPF